MKIKEKKISIIEVKRGECFMLVGTPYIKGERSEEGLLTPYYINLITGNMSYLNNHFSVTLKPKATIFLDGEPSND